MTARAFTPDDLEQLNEWYVARGFPGIALEQLPKHGRIVDGVAAGFLYRTDSNIALLEGYLTNPSAGLRRRNEAINSITAALLAEAKRRGVSQVVAICAARGIERRAQKFGMRTIGVFAMASRRV